MSMQIRLMFRDRDFKSGTITAYGKELLMSDLETGRIISAAAKGDDIVKTAFESALYSPLLKVEEIEYRQAVLRDARAHEETIRSMYQIVDETIRKQNGAFRVFSASNANELGKAMRSAFRIALNFLAAFLPSLVPLRHIADKQIKHFESEGFRNLFATLSRELDDKYLKLVKEKLGEIEGNDNEAIVSAKLGHYMNGVDYVFRKLEKSDRRAWKVVPAYTLSERDATMGGVNDLDNRIGRALGEVANTLAQSAKNIESFFILLREELAFYIGCLNLESELKTLGYPICIPKILPIGDRKRTIKSVHDVALILGKKTKVIPNDLVSDGTELFVITGANQGGKSTYLRSLGQAMLMAQCGMGVAAESCSMPLRASLFTHFRREEDSRMKSGKLDEELTRLGRALDYIKPDGTVMFNESFASTNEREGSEILRQITRAFRENGIEVFAVTHLYDYAETYENDPKTRYLKAERREDGVRTFKIIDGKPEITAYGEDIYREIFG